MGAPGHLHRPGRLRARAVGDAGAPRAGMAPGRAAGAGSGAGRRGAADRPPEPGGGGRGVRRDHPPGLPGLGTALALAQAHEHRAHDAPDRARAQPPAQRAGPLPGRQRRRAHGDRDGRGSARPGRRRRARLRRDGDGPGRRTPGGGRASADRAGDRALHAHPARAALHAGAAALPAAGGVHVGRAGPQRRGGLRRGRHRPGRRGGSDRGAADRPALTVGGLPRLGGHDGSRPCRHVQLEPDLRPVALAPDRP